MTNKSNLLQDFMDKKVRSRGRNKGEVYGEYGHVYYSGDVMYSYGSHFPLLIRHSWGYLLNADKYSSTTSQHQSMCRGVATIQIPLSALRTAGIPYDKFNLIEAGSVRIDILGYYTDHKDKTLTPAEYSQLNRREQRHCGSNGGSEWDGDKYIGYREPTEYWTYKREEISVAQYQALPESERNIWSAREERRPQHDVIEHDGRYFLSGMDGENYFLCQLPEPVKTVEEAIGHLIPNELRQTRWNDETNKSETALIAGVVRQGEWFFQKETRLEKINPKEYIAKYVKEGDAERIAEVTKEIAKRNKATKAEYNSMQKNFVLPLDAENSHRHTATRGMLKDGIIYVTGTVRHTEHQTLKLSTADAPVIYRAYRNRAVESFSVNGRVD